MMATDAAIPMAEPIHPAIIFLPRPRFRYPSLKHATSSAATPVSAPADGTGSDAIATSGMMIGNRMRVRPPSSQCSPRSDLRPGVR